MVSIDDHIRKIFFLDFTRTVAAQLRATVLWNNCNIIMWYRVYMLHVEKSGCNIFANH